MKNNRLIIAERLISEKNLNIIEYDNEGFQLVIQKTVNRF